MKTVAETSSFILPDGVRSLFWEYDADALDWDLDRDLIVRRILTTGDWAAITWLRSSLGDASLGAWIEERGGDELSPRQLRFWELVLDLPAKQVDLWIESRRREAWERRTAR